MGKSYNTIAFHPKKCNGCNECMTACAKAHEDLTDTAYARIQIVPDTDNSTYGIAQCRQCANPRCVMDCPAKALAKNAETGVVEWNRDKCVNCQLCTLACSWAGITFNAKSKQVQKCDHCFGDPSCAKACKTGALQYITLADIYNRHHELEDLFVPGMYSCVGCNSELFVRHTLRKIGPNTVVATPPGCIAGSGAVGVNGKTCTKTPVFHPLLTNTSAMLAGARRSYKRQGRDVTMLALAGDGGTADVGFQSLSGAAERGEQIIFVCVDNEGYMNTGAQRSSTTPYGAWTSTTPVGSVLRGKTNDPKPIAVLMMMHNCEYVATASMAFMEDYYQKLEKAKEAVSRGMVYIHVFSPCTTGWRHAPGKTIEIGRKVVETNLFPLWEYSKQTDKLKFTHPIDNPAPIKEYLSLIGKYRHLSEEQIDYIQESSAKKLSLLKKFAFDI